MDTDFAKIIETAQPGESLTQSGFAAVKNLLTPAQCDELIGSYECEESFRSHIQMAQYRFGRGEYKYFHYPLPLLVEILRKNLYAKLVPTANQWPEWLGEGTVFPPTLDELLTQCHRAGQKRPTPLLLRYNADD